MNRTFVWLLFVIPTILSLSAGILCAEETVQFGRFGTVTVYRQTPKPSQVVLFVSGDGGWNLGVVDMARELSGLDALVAGVDIVHYLRQLEGSSESCSYPAADFEALSQFIEKKFDFPEYILPVLVGYSSGATLVYATLVQAPTNTFRGAISLGFCPDLPLTKPFCKGSGLEWEPGAKGKGARFLPTPELETPWIALQGTIDQVCDPAATEAYVKKVGQAELVLLPKVGHGFSVPGNWMPQFRRAFSRLAEASKREPGPADEGLKDLPLVEVPAKGPTSTLLAVVVSGDGGWAGLDKEVAGVLANRGVSVVGLNSLQYFWKARTPEEAATDLDRIIRHYLSTWKKEHVALIGYSRGADVLPFMANRLPQQMLGKTVLIALLGPGHTVSFEFHLTDWLQTSPSGKALPIEPELEKLRGENILCFFGEKEKDSLCRGLEPGLAKCFPMPGAHHFGGNYADIAEAILKEIGDREAR